MFMASVATAEAHRLDARRSLDAVATVAYKHSFIGLVSLPSLPPK